MTAVTLRILVDKGGASQAVREFREDVRGIGPAAEQGSQQATSGVNAISGAIQSARAAVGAFVAAYAAIQSLSGVVRLADEYQGLSSRLRLATDSTEEFQAAQQGVFAVAQQTGVALGAVTTLYTRLSQSTESLGLNQGQLLTITQAINQAFVVSGAGAGETDAAIRQLAQGFASGTLRGDEFNSVMENAPRLSQALADSLGVTVGELRKMAAEGKLTSDVLANGLLTQAPAIAAEFDQMGTTVGRALTQISNATLAAVGGFDQSTGASSELARQLGQVAQVITNVANLFVDTGPRATAAADDVGFLAQAFQVVALAANLTVNAVQAAVQFIVGAVSAAVTSLRGILDAAQAAASGSLENARQLLSLDFSGFARAQVQTAVNAFERLRETGVSAFGALERGVDGAVLEFGEFQTAINVINAPLRRVTAETGAATDQFGRLAPRVAESRREMENATTQAGRAASAFAGVTATNTTMRGAFDGVTARIEVFADRIEESGERASDWSGYWQGAVGAVADAFGDFVASGLRSFSDFGDQLKNIARRIISDLVSQFLRSNLRIPVSLAGVGGSGSAAASPGGLLGSIGGGLGGGIGGLLGGLGGLIGGTATGLGTGLLASASIFSGAGLFGGIAGSIGAGVASIAGGAFLQGVGLLLGPIGLIGGAVAALASLFRDDTPRLRVGPSQNDGRAVGAFGAIGVARDNLPAGTATRVAESIAEFDNAIASIVRATGGGAEQLTAIGAVLANWTSDVRGSSATAEEILGRRFSAILGTFETDVVEFVGSVGTVEERIARFADALTIAAIASRDNGITDSFDALADLLTQFRESGEELGTTFARIAGGLQLVDGAVALVGATFQGTRIQAATFAAELVRAAGGLEAFASTLQGALQALFTDEERNQFLAEQARASLNAALANLGIEGRGLDSIRETLREQLRAALGAGDVAQTNAILAAANALGVFRTSLEALGEDALAAANDLVLGGPRPIAGATGTAAPTQTELAQSAVRNGERQISLLEQIARNTAPVGSDTTTKDVRDTAGNTRAMIDVLRQILARLSAQQSVAVQEAIKRRAGSNGR